MRFVIIIPGSLLLLVWIFLIGVTRTTPIPEKMYPHPKNAQEFLSRGQLYERHDKLEQALADYTQAVKLEPKNSIALLRQASMLAALNRPEEAIQKYQIVKRLDQEKGYSTALTDYSIQEQQKKLHQMRQQK
jgi:tetratricopeptide (TPR) repeat protein